MTEYKLKGKELDEEMMRLASDIKELVNVHIEMEAHSTALNKLMNRENELLGRLGPAYDDFKDIVIKNKK